MLARGVSNQPVGRIHRLQEVAERGVLQPVERLLADWFVAAHAKLSRITFE